jgi:hypothetical protein
MCSCGSPLQKANRASEDAASLSTVSKKFKAQLASGFYLPVYVDGFLTGKNRAAGGGIHYLLVQSLIVRVIVHSILWFKRY